MSVRSFAQTVVFGAVVFVGGVTAAQATFWDAYSDFISGPTPQSTDNTWQYSSVNGGGYNSGYTLLDRWGDNGDGPLGNGWTSTQSYDTWHNQLVYADTTTNHELLVHPFYDTSNPSSPDLSTVVGWRSPITGTVNVSFSVTDRNGSGGDGVEYWLYKSGAADAGYLKHGTVENGQDWTSGPIAQSGISVVAGDMLYLQVDPRGSYNADLTGVSMSVSSVPEPTTLVLLATGLFGLLAYAWRKRK